MPVDKNEWEINILKFNKFFKISSHNSTYINATVYFI